MFKGPVLLSGSSDWWPITLWLHGFISEHAGSIGLGFESEMLKGEVGESAQNISIMEAITLALNLGYFKEQLVTLFKTYPSWKQWSWL